MSKKQIEDCLGESDLPWVNSSLYATPEYDNSIALPDKPLLNVQCPVPFQETAKIADSNAAADFSRKEYVSFPYFQQFLGNIPHFSPDFEKFQQSQMEFLGTVPCVTNDHRNKMTEMPFSTKNVYRGSMQKEHYHDKCFIINLFIETRDSHLGPFPLEVHPKTNIRLLKLQLWMFILSVLNLVFPVISF